MPVSVRQQVRVGTYLFKQKLKKRDKFPLLIELEPLFACNLACAGCGKIQYPPHMLKQRMSVDTAISAIAESGAPMVSIAGGEPLIHPEVHVIAQELIKRKKFVYLCTNALLMQKKMHLFKPLRTSRGRCTWTACASAMTNPSARKACSTWRSMPSRRRSRRGSASRPTRPSSATTRRRTSETCWTS